MVVRLLRYVHGGTVAMAVIRLVRGESRRIKPVYSASKLSAKLMLLGTFGATLKDCTASEFLSVNDK
jgi:hypothetical protein